jgi:hypothetical protein
MVQVHKHRVLLRKGAQNLQVGSDQVHPRMGAEKPQVGNSQVHHRWGVEKRMAGNDQDLLPRGVQRLQVGNPLVPVQIGLQKLMAGNEQVHLRREAEKLQAGIRRVVTAQRSHPVPAKTVNCLLVTKRRHQQGGTRWQRDREAATRVLLVGTRLWGTLRKHRRDNRETATRMQAREWLSEATGAGIHRLVTLVGAARGITNMTGTLTAVIRGGVARTTPGGPTIVMTMAVVVRHDPRQEGSPRGGYVNTTRVATAGRVRNASTCTGDRRGRVEAGPLFAWPSSHFCIAGCGFVVVSIVERLLTVSAPLSW